MNQDAITAAITLLREHGYYVHLPQLLQETTVSQLRILTGLKGATLHKRLHHRACPPWRATLCGPTGRCVRLRVSEEALAWLKQPVKQ